MTKMGRPLKGKTNRKLVSIRLAPDEKELLIKHFGGVQVAVDFAIGFAKAEKYLAPKKKP